MNGRTRRISALLGLAAIAIMLLLGSSRAGAQPITWNPPCGFMNVMNFSACTVAFTPWTNIPITVFAVPPGRSVLFMVPAGLTINGVRSQAGVLVPMVSPGPPPPPPPGPPAATTGWVRGVVQGPPFPGCCVDIYFDVPACMVWIMPGTKPCTP